MTTESMRSTIRYDYRDTRVLVTGGTSGIGEAIATAYAEAGADVTITGTRASSAEYPEKDLSRFRYLSLDLGNADAVAAVAAALPALDVLVSNAGTAFPGGRDEHDPDVFEEALRINLASGYRLAHHCRDALQKSHAPGGASVVGIASMTSYFGLELVPGYGAAKAGLVQLVKSLAIEWAPLGIRVNAVAAGLIDTRMTAPMLAEPSLRDPFLARTPMARPGLPAEIAGAVLFLTSSAASYVTGTTLIVDGGFSIRG